MKKILVLCLIIWHTLLIQGQTWNWISINYDEKCIVTIEATPAEEMGGVNLDTLKVYHIPQNLIYYTKPLDACQIHCLIDNGYYYLADSIAQNYGIAKTIVHRKLYIQNDTVQYQAFSEFVWTRIYSCCIILGILLIGVLLRLDKKLTKLIKQTKV